MLNIYNIQNRLIEILRQATEKTSYINGYNRINEYCQWANDFSFDSRAMTKAEYLTQQKQRNEDIALRIARECGDLMAATIEGGLQPYDPWCCYADYIVMPIRVGDLLCKVTVITLFPVKICYFQHSKRLKEGGHEQHYLLVEGSDYGVIVREMADKIAALYA